MGNRIGDVFFTREERDKDSQVSVLICSSNEDQPSMDSHKERVTSTELVAMENWCEYQDSVATKDKKLSCEVSNLSERLPV